MQGQRVWSDKGLFSTLTRNPEFVLHAERVAEALGGLQGYRVYDSNKQVITLTAIGGEYSKTGLYSVNDRIRKLTPRECVRLQGLPEDFKITVSDSQAYKQFGNVPPVNVINEIIKQLKTIVVRENKREIPSLHSGTSDILVLGSK